MLSLSLFLHGQKQIEEGNAMKPEAKSENAAPVKKAKAETLIQWERQMVKNQFLHPKPL